MIEASDMVESILDMIKARRHQTGATIQHIVQYITVGDLIKENDVAGGKGIVQYEALAVSINTDKLNIYTADKSTYLNLLVSSYKNKYLERNYYTRVPQ